METIKYVRLHAGPDGESHFEDVEIGLRLGDFAPPAPPLWLSAFLPAERVRFLSASPGWYGDWHPAPRRQFLVYIAGDAEGEASDGEVRRFGPGSIVLLEDTTGKGHRSRLVGATDVINVVVQLPD